MQRRIMLKVLASSGTLLSLPCGAAKARGSGSLTRYRNGSYDDAGVFYSHGVHSANMPDGSWNLWVRAVAPNEEDYVSIKLEVSTDEGFQNIVHSSHFTANKNDSYIVRTNYAPPQKSKLYFRFISSDAEAIVARATGRIGRTLSTSPVGILDVSNLDN